MRVAAQLCLFCGWGCGAWQVGIGERNNLTDKAEPVVTHAYTVAGSINVRRRIILCCKMRRHQSTARMPKEGGGIKCNKRNPSSCRAVVVGRIWRGDLRLNLSEVVLILSIVDVDKHTVVTSIPAAISFQRI